MIERIEGVITGLLDTIDQSPSKENSRHLSAVILDLSQAVLNLKESRQYGAFSAPWRVEAISNEQDGANRALHDEVNRIRASIGLDALPHGQYGSIAIDTNKGNEAAEIMALLDSKNIESEVDGVPLPLYERVLRVIAQAEGKEIVRTRFVGDSKQYDSLKQSADDSKNAVSLLNDAGFPVSTAMEGVRLLLDIGGPSFQELREAHEALDALGVPDFDADGKTPLRIRMQVHAMMESDKARSEWQERVNAVCEERDDLKETLERCVAHKAIIEEHLNGHIGTIEQAHRTLNDAGAYAGGGLLVGRIDALVRSRNSLENKVAKLTARLEAMTKPDADKADLLEYLGKLNIVREGRSGVMSLKDRVKFAIEIYSGGAFDYKDALDAAHETLSAFGVDIEDKNGNDYELSTRIHLLVDKMSKQDSSTPVYGAFQLRTEGDLPAGVPIQKNIFDQPINFVGGESLSFSARFDPEKYPKNYLKNYSVIATDAHKVKESAELRYNSDEAIEAHDMLDGFDIPRDSVDRPLTLDERVRAYGDMMAAKSIVMTHGQQVMLLKSIPDMVIAEFVNDRPSIKGLIGYFNDAESVSEASCEDVDFVQFAKGAREAAEKFAAESNEYRKKVEAAESAQDDAPPSRLCGSCKFRNEYGCCTSSKISDEGQEDADAEDMLIYEYPESGEFFVGKKFGCVHHQPIEETK